MKRTGRLLAAGLALTMMLAMTACGSDNDNPAASDTTTTVTATDDAVAAELAALESDPAVQELVAFGENRTTYVGKVTGTERDAYVAIVDDGDGGITAYVCDGEAIAAWAEGRRSGETVSASGPSGLTIDATVTGETVSGTAYVPGWGTHPLNASLAAHPAGLWRPIDTETGEFAGLTVGWIVLADGSQRGLALTPQKKVQIVEPVNTVSGPAGNSASGPVTTDAAARCRMLLGMWNNDNQILSDPQAGPSLKAEAAKNKRLVAGLYDKEGCPGEQLSPD